MKKIKKLDKYERAYFKKIRIVQKNNEDKRKKNIKEKKYKRKKIFIILKWFFSITAILSFLFLGGLFILFSSLNIPNIDNFDKRKISNSTKIYDRTGKILLYDIHKNIQRSVVSSDQISQNIKDAIISIEDHDFYNHHGVIWKSTIRAVFQTLLSKIGISKKSSAGGSTLTQQVVKNTLLTNERTITRKMKEWVLAYKIEKKLSKDKILTIYLNEAPYGGTIYGIQEASRVFFGKTASNVTIAEAAYLASIPNLPTFYSPYGPNKDKLDERHDLVLREMKKYGYISDNEYREALKEKVIFLPQENNYAKALHFVQYVRSILEKKYGNDVVENGGLKVITTLDYKLQQQAEEIIKKHIEDIGEEEDASNSALVAIESKTGNVITMVGSKNYFDTDNFDGNFNVAISPRQPGSAFKPFAYATAFEKGYLPESAIFDVKTQFNSRCQPEDFSNKNGCYSPNNWDFKFKGALSFRNALAQSRNIPAIKVLYLAGISNVIDKTHEMGITSLTKDPNYYGLGLVLGGGEVSLLEMVSAYTTFSNNGKHNKANFILEITDANGNILEKYKKEERRVFSKNTSSMISSILSDNIARTPLYGAYSGLYFGNKDVAGKTGTTDDKRDAWMIGYTTEVAVGVWTGNNDNTPMKKGSKLSIKPWHDFMKIILDEYDSGNFKKYDIPENFLDLPNMIRGEWHGDITYIIDSVSGKLATKFTPENTKIRVTNFDPHTILYSVNKNNPYILGNSKNDSQYKNWEYGVQQYSLKNYSDLYNKDFEVPTEYDDIHGENGNINNDKFNFVLDGVKDFYDLGDMVNINIDFKDEVIGGLSEIRYYINNIFIGSLNSEPYNFSFNINDIQHIQKENVLRVVIEDNHGDIVSREKKINIKSLDNKNTNN